MNMLEGDFSSPVVVFVYDIYSLDVGECDALKYRTGFQNIWNQKPRGIEEISGQTCSVYNASLKGQRINAPTHDRGRVNG